jgi:hypothetical protein
MPGIHVFVFVAWVVIVTLLENGRNPSSEHFDNPVKNLWSYLMLESLVDLSCCAQGLYLLPRISHISYLVQAQRSFCEERLGTNELTG